ncbi:PSY2 [[Candida] subhashii]|uniref:Serine/threonine-protein phosphatase 4 regulatory subunit 3 n=1 Tax=[Candida] subhashii TaxID=561895 RepID=A0A8J5UIT6_9ASCO|nr:PSY2 [[Candida] subhashii]KAG7660451.1 PSY2 [[Candida] subhashii]
MEPISGGINKNQNGNTSSKNENKSSSGQTPRRVKVYLLNGEDWIDNGTGYCVGEIDPESKLPYFLVRNELNSNDIILKSFLEGSIQYQRQQETLIVWTDTSGKDLALSFQENEGCADLCDFIIKVQQESLSPGISLYYVIPHVSEGDDITELITGPVVYPQDPTDDNLESVLEVINQGSSSQFTRTKISQYIIDNKYFLKLVDGFNRAEKMKKLKNLYTLSEIIKSLFLYNETTLVEDFLDTDEKVLALSGILEYDSEYPKHKSCHRDFLKTKSFKSVMPVANLEIFKKDFHLNFLKDVVLARFLDDQTFNLLSTLIYLNQVEIINYLKDNTILQKLFQIYTDDETDLELKRDGVKMLHQYVLIAKSLQSFQKLEFFSLLVKNGLFQMINFALNDSDNKIRVLGTELIVIIIEQDVSLVHSIDREETIDNSDPPTLNTMLEELNKEEDSTTTATTARQQKEVKLKLSDDMTLISILAKLLAKDKNPGLKLQAVEALRILLDTNIASNGGSTTDSNGDDNGGGSMNDTSGEFKDINTKNYFTAFYSQVAPTLFNKFIILAQSNDLEDESIKSLIYSDELLFQHLCDLISFCTREHTTLVSRPFFLENHILLGAAKLLDTDCKLTLKLSVIRCIKNIIGLNDNLYCRYILVHDILGYFIRFFETVVMENNLANSTCLDFLEIILRNCDNIISSKLHNYKLLAKYFYDNYKEFLETKLDYVTTGRDFIEVVERFAGSKSTTPNQHLHTQEIKTDEIGPGSDQEFLERNASTPINDDEFVNEDNNNDHDSSRNGNSSAEDNNNNMHESKKEDNSPPEIINGDQHDSINGKKRKLEQDADAESNHRIKLQTKENKAEEEEEEDMIPNLGSSPTAAGKFTENFKADFSNGNKSLATVLSTSPEDTKWGAIV